jgi:hypothetical protein
MGLSWFFLADTLQKQTFTKTRGIMSVNPLYQSDNYCLVLFHAMLMVKNLYLSTINTRHAPPHPPLLQTCHRVVLLTYDKAQSSVSHTRHHGRVTELALRRRHPRSPSLRLCRSPVFAISLGNPCALQIVRSWPGMAVGR